jgi:hypothetical protein
VSDRARGWGRAPCQSGSLRTAGLKAGTRPEGLRYSRFFHTPVRQARDPYRTLNGFFKQNRLAGPVQFGTIVDIRMRFQQIGLSLFSLIAIVSIILAAATIWLFLTNPVTVANAVNEGDVSPFVRDLAQVLYNALRGILKYL